MTKTHTATLAIAALDRPATPAGAPQVEITLLGISDGSSLPFGEIAIGEDKFSWEMGYMDAPTLFENPDPEYYGSGDMVEHPDWADYLADRDIDVDPDLFGEHIKAVIERAASLSVAVMAQAIEQAQATMLDALNG